MRYTQSVLIDYCASYKFNSNFNEDKSFHFNEKKDFSYRMCIAKFE